MAASRTESCLTRLTIFSLPATQRRSQRSIPRQWKRRWDFSPRIIPKPEGAKRKNLWTRVSWTNWKRPDSSNRSGRDPEDQTHLNRLRSSRSRFTMPLLPEPRKAFTGSAPNGVTFAMAPSTTHSSIVSGPMLSFLRTLTGTNTCPRLVTLVRIWASYKTNDSDATSWLLVIHGDK